MDARDALKRGLYFGAVTFGTAALLGVNGGAQTGKTGSSAYAAFRRETRGGDPALIDLCKTPPRACLSALANEPCSCAAFKAATIGLEWVG